VQDSHLILLELQFIVVVEVEEQDTLVDQIQILHHQIVLVAVADQLIQTVVEVMVHQIPVGVEAAPMTKTQLDLALMLGAMAVLVLLLFDTSANN
jgi:hypothetical protein